MRILSAACIAAMLAGCGGSSGGRAGDVFGSDATTTVDTNQSTAGTDGTTAADGTDGTTAADGTDGTTAADGTDGTSATDGVDGTSATDGTTATDGVDGTSATDGVDGTSATDGVDGTTATDGVDGSSGMSALVDPNCIDGQYTEALPTGQADISAEMQLSGQMNIVMGLLNKRYPIGAYLVNLAKDEGINGTSENCVAYFLGGKTSPQAILSDLGTVVHECGHVADLLDLFNPSYIITPELSFSCQGGSIPQYGGKTFSRSLIKNDKYAQLHVPCEDFFDNNCDDTYAGIYLDGDPTDSTFESGDQGFDTVLEETLQYVNSLATGLAFVDQKGGFSTSDRDGILTFLWYVQRYLRMARLEYPQAYKLLSEDQCWRRSILTVWGRAWLYLKATEQYPSLGIDDAKLEGLATDPELLAEIQALRGFEGCQ